MNTILFIEKRSRKEIKEYQERIKDCDRVLDIIKKDKNRIRRGELPIIDLESLKIEFIRETTRRQNYIQFLSFIRGDILGEI
jgi:hypothetical protein